MIRYVVLISLWGAWCFLHSFMITHAVTGFVRKRFEKTYRYYRIFYNVMALVTLIPVWGYGFTIKGLPVFHWDGLFRIVQGLLVVWALLFLLVLSWRKESYGLSSGRNTSIISNACQCFFRSNGLYKS